MCEELRAYSMDLISDEPTDVNSEVYKNLDNQFRVYGGEAIYIYSFEERKMLFTKGWGELLGYSDDEITMKQIGKLTDPDQIKFTELVNEASVRFCCEKRDDVDQYSYVYRINKIHKDGRKIPLNWRVSIYKQKDGFATQIIGHAQLLHGVPFGKSVYFEGHGPDSEEFERVLESDLFEEPRCSSKEMEVLVLVCDGLSYKEIADKLGVSQSAIEKRVRPMFKRFNVTSLPHLISFAYKNRILGSN